MSCMLSHTNIKIYDNYYTIFFFDNGVDVKIINIYIPHNLKNM